MSKFYVQCFVTIYKHQETYCYYRESVQTTKDIVELMMVSHPTGEEDVRRDFLLMDALREGRKKKFCPNKQLKVRIYEKLI